MSSNDNYVRGHVVTTSLPAVSFNEIKLDHTMTNKDAKQIDLMNCITFFFIIDNTNISMLDIIKSNLVCVSDVYTLF